MVLCGSGSQVTRCRDPIASHTRIREGPERCVVSHPGRTGSGHRGRRETRAQPVEDDGLGQAQVVQLAVRLAAIGGLTWLMFGVFGVGGGVG